MSKAVMLCAALSNTSKICRASGTEPELNKMIMMLMIDPLLRREKKEHDFGY